MYSTEVEKLIRIQWRFAPLQSVVDALINMDLLENKRD